MWRTLPEPSSRGEAWLSIGVIVVYDKGVKFGQRPRLQWWFFCYTSWRNDVFNMLDNIRIKKGTFRRHCG